MNWTRFQVRLTDLQIAARERGLAYAGHVLDQQMAFGQYARNSCPDNRLLAVQHLGHVGDQAVVHLHKPGDVGPTRGLRRNSGGMACHGRRRAHVVASNSG